MASFWNGINGTEQNQPPLLWRHNKSEFQAFQQFISFYRYLRGTDTTRDLKMFM
ncbi:hypothetical protein J4Q44_G00122660 [Coregonus suidteri]|uniref:Uncharacterized protein n=1 Tax=Coregonus suidteri TaxID=861788 RepID=A0AAN8QYJ4_9TELE